MFRNLSLSRAIFFALFAGLITAGMTLPAQVQAQTPSTEADDAEVPVVVVTGSAIRRIEGESSLPVQVLDAQAIARTGASSVVDLIQRLPTVSGQSVESDAVGGATFNSPAYRCTTLAKIARSYC
jgi:outer membrane cobalamin receptor